MGNGTAQQAAQQPVGDLSRLFRDVKDELEQARDQLAGAADDLERHRHDQLRLEGLVDAVLSNTGDAVIVVGHDLRIQGWSRRAESLWKTSYSAALSSQLETVVGSGDHTADALSKLSAAATGDAPLSHIELPNPHGDTVRFRVAVLADPVETTHRIVLVEA